MPVPPRQVAARDTLADALLQINKMRAAIMHETGVVEALHARIAAAKLAHAEADDQTVQFAQALAVEEAAVAKVSIC
jgi:hypothetical protein